MTHGHHARLVIIAVSLAALAAVATPKPAAAGDERWWLRISGVSVAPDLEIDQMDGEGQRTTADAGSAIGFGVGIECRLSDRLGVALGFLSAEPDITVQVTPASGGPVVATDSLSFRPLTAGLNVHLTPESRVDLSVGLMAAWVSYGDLVLDAAPGQRLELDSGDDVGWGATLGAEIRLGEGPWSVALFASYLDTTLEVTNRSNSERQEVDVDPFIFGLGVGYRF